jgi:hypothetical protein
MRIACIHIPQFALQSATRIDPALRGAAVAVVSGVEPGRETAGVLHTPIVLACSRAAWAQGVRLGMTAPAVRGLAAGVQIVTADAAAERETVRAVADTLLGMSSVVDTGGRVGGGGAHLAMYAEVPAKTRGSTFGDRLLELLDEMGLTARVGIADDRFTAWVAAAHSGHEERGVITVPRGGSAAFLAPRPLSLLAISPEVQHMLEALGVRTLGEFAALPAPSVARPLEADYQALARGESDALLRPYTPEVPIREEVTVSARSVLELQDLLPAGERARGLSVAAAIALVARRLQLRLDGRGRAAARLDITAIARDGAFREVPVTLADGVADAEDLGHVLAHALEPVSAEHATAHDDWRVRVVVGGEVVLGGAMTDIFAEGSQRYATPNDVYVASDARELCIARDGHAAPRPPEISAASSTSSASSARHERRRDRQAADRPSTELGALAVVLSSSGSLFALSPPGVATERRAVHRRMRRGKQRRSRPTSLAQPRLFDRTSAK